MLGFDLGSNELKIAVWDGSKLTSLISAETPENLVKSGVIISYDAMADYIKDLLKNKGIKGKEASVILPAGRVFIRRSVLPYMDREKLLINLPYEFRDYLTVDKTKYYYDYVVNSTEDGEDGKPVQIDITAAAVLKETIEDYRAMFRRAGLKLKYAIPTEFAYGNLIAGLSEEKKKKEYCFLDLGHLTSRLDIFSGNAFETSRIIDGGLAELDQLISEQENVDYHIAHEYKETNYRNIDESEAAAAVYGRIATDVRRAINFYGLNNRESNIEEIICSGGGSCVSALKSTISEQLNMKTLDIADYYPAADCNSEKASLFSLAIGAALNKDVNLAQKEKSEFRPQILIPLVVAVLVAAALFGKFAVYDRYQQLSELNSRLAEAQARKSALTIATADYDEVKAEYDKYSIGWMNPEEKALLLKSEVLKMVEDELVPNGRIYSVLSSGNIVTCKIAGITLDDTSNIVQKLYTRDDVLGVEISSAQSQDGMAEYTVTKDNGEEVTEQAHESLVTITVTMIKFA